jgi:hypothetical protein
MCALNIRPFSITYAWSATASAAAALCDQQDRDAEFVADCKQTPRKILYDHGRKAERELVHKKKTSVPTANQKRLVRNCESGDAFARCAVFAD